MNFDWNKWKQNFCEHISDWSYFSADEELERMKELYRSQLLTEVLEMIEEVKTRNGKEVEDPQKAIGLKLDAYNQALDDLKAELQKKKEEL